ncbi:MAG: transcriptional repressor LexA [SAR324 cluster bacterium]|nr:transcriptional repressor LexA [SAR324 cluster bacterium]
MKGITQRQQDVLSYIGEYVEEKGFPPAVRDIAKRFNLASAAGVHKHIKALVRKGYLAKEKYISRSLRVIRPNIPARNTREMQFAELPLAGYVAAGQPIEAVEQGGEYVTVPADLLSRPTGNYVLKVRGDSMIEECIADGDYVIMEPRESAENGEMVVALINGQEATLKRIYREAGRVRLQPSNAAMDPIFISDQDVRVQGIVVGIWRRY